MKTIKTIFGKVKRHLISYLVSPFIQKDDKKLFTAIATEAKNLYSKRKDTYEYTDFLMPSWQKNTTEIESIFLNELPFSFLRNQMLKHTMFAHLPKSATMIEKGYLKKNFDDSFLKMILKEHSTGKPILNDFEFRSSGNSIHHLFHLAKFYTENNQEISTIDHIIEYGGGYGNMARIAKNINQHCTYTIIDIPIFSYIQLVYLRTVLGKDNVVLFEDTNEIQPGKVNIIPLHIPLLKALATSDYTPNIFVSTWALSESNKKTQEMVLGFDYFKARSLLLAYQKKDEKFAYAQDIENLPNTYTTDYATEIECLPNNYYLFASRK